MKNIVDYTIVVETNIEKLEKLVKGKLSEGKLMRTTIYRLFVVWFLILSGCSNIAIKQELDSHQSYKNTRLGFSIDIPSLWKIQEQPLYVLFSPENVIMNTAPLGVFPKNYKSFEYLMVSYYKSKPNKTLEDMGKMYVKGAEVFNETYSASPPRKLKIANKHAIKFEESLIEQGYKMKGIIFMLPNGERGLTLTFRANPAIYKKHKNLYEDIAQSFLLLP